MIIGLLALLAYGVYTQIPRFWDLFVNEAERRMGLLHSELVFASMEEMIEMGLHEYLDTFQTRLNKVDDAIRSSFFSMEPTKMQGGGAVQ